MTIRPLLTALACALAASCAHAQLHLPQLQLPQLPQLPLQDRVAGPLLRDSQRLLDRRDIADLRNLRMRQIGELLNRHRDVLDADPRGEPVVRHEILAWGASQDGLAAARTEGLSITGGADGLLVLRAPAGVDMAAMLERLRAADPGGAYDYNHIYTGSAAPEEPQGGQERPTLGRQPGAGGGAGAGPGTATGPGARAAAAAGAGFVAGAGTATETGPRSAAGAGAGPGAGAAAPRVGLVDSGVERGHEVFADAAIESWGCDGGAHPAAHGTAVAALMIGRSARFSGAAPQATLYAADIYCDSPTGGSAARIAAALDWLARRQVMVINLSLVGPHNQILERVVRAMVQRGHLLVAAVGNDGPAAPPLYPASYPGVVGVTGVDRQGRPLPEAARGPQVMFAAPGSQMVSAAIGSPPYRTVRGTSYAAPLVAALLCQGLGAPSPQASQSALARLILSAAGSVAGSVAGNATATRGNDTGYGVLGMALRNDPSAFR